MSNSITNQIAEGETLTISHGDKKGEFTLMMETEFGQSFYNKIKKEKSLDLNGSSNSNYILFLFYYSSIHKPEITKLEKLFLIFLINYFIS